MNRLAAVFACASAALLGACAVSPASVDGGNRVVSRYDATDDRAEDEPLLGPTFAAVDHLVDQMERRVALDAPILVATPQNIVSLGRASEFGLSLGELVQSRIAEHGLGVIEVKLQEHLRINDAGELLLSRDISDLARVQHADIVVVGTWAEGSRGGAYVTLKAIRAVDGVVVASSSIALSHAHWRSLPRF